MKFSKIFQNNESLNLDKKTLVFLRWIAIIGQLITIYFVYLILKFDLPIIFCTVTLSLGLLTNFYLQFLFKKSTVNDFESTAILIFDLLLLGILLFLTGGIKNPFIIFLIVPAIVSSTLLNLRNTAMICLITILLLTGLTFYHFPIPSPGKIHFHVPGYFLYAITLSLIIALIFLSYFGTRFGIESRKKTQALNKLELIIAKEHELESIGLQAAAAAHSLGTPLATISVVSRELRKEIAKESKYSDDLDLLISQTNRCKEILKKISEKQIIDDRFISNVSFEDLLSEIVKSFKETSDKKVTIKKNFEQSEINLQRSSEIVYGLRNFIGNAFKFSTKEISIKLEKHKKIVNLVIEDDGPGFPDDIKEYLGEPYIKSKSKKIISKVGLGLGTFLGKTILERQNAKILFGKSALLNGAKVTISWNLKALTSNS
mgnify:CR=1 FL=1